MVFYYINSYNNGTCCHTVEQEYLNMFIPGHFQTHFLVVSDALKPLLH